mmetsp:Transcript_25079/g.63645  ORF Transcript_25079/g.63645 Transcript_25079/m.63645 type:complete len:584 (+) Transcript_25079:1071-2822(+)
MRLHALDRLRGPVDSAQQRGAYGPDHGRAREHLLLPRLLPRYDALRLRGQRGDLRPGLLPRLRQRRGAHDRVRLRLALDQGSAPQATAACDGGVAHAQGCEGGAGGQVEQRQRAQPRARGIGQKGGRVTRQARLDRGQKGPEHQPPPEGDGQAARRAHAVGRLHERPAPLLQGATRADLLQHHRGGAGHGVHALLRSRKQRRGRRGGHVCCRRRARRRGRGPHRGARADRADGHPGGGGLARRGDVHSNLDDHERRVPAGHARVQAPVVPVRVVPLQQVPARRQPRRYVAGRHQDPGGPPLEHGAARAGGARAGGAGGAGARRGGHRRGALRGAEAAAPVGRGRARDAHERERQAAEDGQGEQHLRHQRRHHRGRRCARGGERGGPAGGGGAQAGGGGAQWRDPPAHFAGGGAAAHGAQAAQGGRGGAGEAHAGAERGGARAAAGAQGGEEPRAAARGAQAAARALGGAQGARRPRQGRQRARARQRGHRRGRRRAARLGDGLLGGARGARRQAGRERQVAAALGVVRLSGVDGEAERIRAPRRGGGGAQRRGGAPRPAQADARDEALGQADRAHAPALAARA